MTSHQISSGYCFSGQPQPIDFVQDSVQSPLKRYTPQAADIDSVIDLCAIFQQQDLAIEQMPELLWPAKGRYGLRDYEKVFYACGRTIYPHTGALIAIAAVWW